MLYINGRPYDATIPILEGIAGPTVTVGGLDKQWTYDELTHNLLAEILIELKTIRLHTSSMSDVDYAERIST